MTETVIKLENIHKKLGHLTAVNNININVKRGEVIGFVGPNGAGKTTTLKLIARLIKPNSGKIFILNTEGKLQNILENPKNLIEMGFLIDIPHFYNSTPYRLLRYIANLRNFPKDKLNQRIDELLEIFNLTKWKYRKVKKFSKGMIQKLGFIGAIIHDPEIIILDEPQTGLDPNARIDVRNYIKSLQGKGKTIFFASHMLYELTEMCDKIALINQGSLIEFDTLDNLESLLKTKELICEILKPIPLEKRNLIVKRLIQSLEPYLENNLDPRISEEPIKYKSHEKSFVIYYNGEEESRANILNILVNEFKFDFTIHSFSKPKTSQLESLYSQLIKSKGENLDLSKRGV